MWAFFFFLETGLCCTVWDGLALWVPGYRCTTTPPFILHSRTTGFLFLVCVQAHTWHGSCLEARGQLGGGRLVCLSFHVCSRLSGLTGSALTCGTLLIFSTPLFSTQSLAVCKIFCFKTWDNLEPSWILGCLYVCITVARRRFVLVALYWLRRPGSPLVFSLSFSVSWCMFLFGIFFEKCLTMSPWLVRNSVKTRLASNSKTWGTSASWVLA